MEQSNQLYLQFRIAGQPLSHKEPRQLHLGIPLGTQPFPTRVREATFPVTRQINSLPGRRHCGLLGPFCSVIFPLKSFGLLTVTSQDGWSASSQMLRALAIFQKTNPIFSVEMLDADSVYLATGKIPCEVLERFQNATGRELVRVSTEKLCGIDSAGGCQNSLFSGA